MVIILNGPLFTYVYNRMRRKKVKTGKKFQQNKQTSAIEILYVN